MTNWEALGKEADLKQAQLERRRTYVDSKERREAMDSLLSKGYEHVFDYKNQNFVKMRKPKTFDICWENKVWLLFRNMGFDIMNKDSSFKISYSRNNPDLTQQIDVFAADEETVIIVECKSSQTPGTKREFKQEIDAFKGNKEGIIRTIKGKFGRKVQIKFVWATINLTLGKDLDRLKEAGIEHFDKEAIDYYTKLAQHLGSASKYQLLGRLFAKKEVRSMNCTVPAIRGKMGGHTYYSFSIEPSRLLKIGYVLHRDDANNTLMPTYQRIIKKKRLDEVRRFVNGGGYFPNSIIISIDAPRGLQFDLKTDKESENEGIPKLGVLHLPKKYCSAYIIDGQHRLYGYSDSAYSESNTIPVVAFENLSKEEQLRLFMEINEHQQAVPKNLRSTLSADIFWASEDYAERRRSLRSKIAQELGEDPDSPLFNRILIGENTKQQNRCITMSSIENGLKDGNYFTSFKNNNAIGIGLFDNTTPENSYGLNLALPFLKLAFGYFKRALPDEWERGDREQGLLTNNTGIYALLHIFSDVLEFNENKHIASAKLNSPEELLKYSEPFFETIVSFYKTLDSDLRTEIKTQYGTTGSSRHWRFLQKAIHDQFNEFAPPGLEDWWTNNSKQYNSCSKEMINEIESRVIDQVRAFVETRSLSLPFEVEAKALKINNERKELELPPISKWDILTLSDCLTIAHYKNYWSEGLKEILTRPSERGRKGGTKNAKTKWLNDMQRINNNIGKPGYSVSQINFEYISSIYGWLIDDCKEEMS